MRGINDTTKREEMVDILKKGKFDLLALTEAKLKGEGEVSWGKANGLISGVHEVERTRERVTVMFSDVLHSAEVKHGYLSRRILWIKFKFSWVKFVWWWNTAPM